jgi:cold shock CspA family protein
MADTTTTSTQQPQQQDDTTSQQQRQRQRPDRSVITRIETPEGQQRFPGIVKTFRKTYGFATVVGDNQYSGKDIMVNHANILTSKECYKTLKRGEHIEFAVQEEEDGRIQALDVTGPDGYSLQCETNPHLYQRRRGRGRGGYRGRGRGRGGHGGHGSHGSRGGYHSSNGHQGQQPDMGRPLQRRQQPDDVTEE